MTTALTQLFFRSAYLAPSTGDIVRWWERRRPIYNVAVGVAGLTSLTAMSMNALLLPGTSGMDISWLGLLKYPVLAYGVMANVMYTMGPILDTLIVRRWGAEYAAIGPALFRYGMAFAVGLTLLPVPISIVALIADWIFALT